MTQKEAVIKSRLLWVWLRNHPEKEKSDYFYEVFPQPRNECYLCEFVDDAGGDCRDHCPLADAFVACAEDGEEVEWEALCETPGTPYTEWKTVEDTESAAAAMVALHDTWLEENR